MPKIEVNEELFYSLVGTRFQDASAFEEALSCAKEELSEDSDKNIQADERIIKIELNDTNRPDLWSTAGCARQLGCYYAGIKHSYNFFSRPGYARQADHSVHVKASVKQVRPYLAGFIASGKAITDSSLRDMIQMQEKLAWNFGRKRRTISMGLYRTELIKWPIIYKAVDPDSVSFVPLQWDSPLTLKEILRQHPKGKEYAFIQEHEALHPLLTDARGEVLSYPPIINSADLGAVQVGDKDLFVELTGTDIACVTLSSSIMACALSDQGFSIEPVTVEYEFDTEFGSKVVTPYYFQEPVFCSLSRVEKFLGKRLSAYECVAALEKMGCKAEAFYGKERGGAKEEEGVLIKPPEYRNDFLHASDVAEDIMIGHGLKAFTPVRPSDFTVGRLSPITLFSRTVKELFIGLGYQEMIYNYLGSYKDFVERMRGGGDTIIRIANPMTESFEYLRNSVLASLLISESMSSHASYPHKIFEVGKVAYKDSSENYGSTTRQHAGFLQADRDTNFNTVAAQLQTLFYYLSCEYISCEFSDPRFILGRCAVIQCAGKSIGIFGELHPEVLENFGITVPVTAAEIDLDAISMASAGPALHP